MSVVQKNKFALQLQESISKKRPEGDAAINWFASELSEASDIDVKPTNIYKWLSGATAREVPAKFIKRKEGEDKDAISRALNLSDTERVALIDAFYTSYAYSEQSKDCFLHLLDSRSLEGLGEATRYRMLRQGAHGRPDPQGAIDKFYAGLGCTKAEGSEPFTKDIYNASISILATDHGLLRPPILEVFVELVAALYTAGYPVHLTLCFSNSKERVHSAKLLTMRHFFPLVFSSIYARRIQDFELQIFQENTSLLPHDLITIGNDEKGYVFLGNSYLTWQGGIGNKVFGSFSEKLAASSSHPFAILPIGKIAQGTAFVMPDAPICAKTTYVLGKTDTKKTISTLSNDTLGDNWIKYGYVLCEGANPIVYLVPYHLDDYLYVPLDELRDDLAKNLLPHHVIGISDPDFVETVRVYRSYLDEISVPNKYSSL